MSGAKAQVQQGQAMAGRLPIAALALVLACCAVYFYQFNLNASQTLISWHKFAVIPRRYFEPVWATINGMSPTDYWPLVTSIFMHGDWLHLALNMAMLILFAWRLEPYLGRAQFLIFFFACGALAGLAHIHANPESLDAMFGASGAIAGLAAAHILLFTRTAVSALGLSIIVAQAAQAAGWLEETGRIAWWAHLGGLAAGAALTPLFALLRPGGPLLARR